MTMDTEQTERYSRHITLQDIGVDGQQKLLDSTALIVGLGGLGSPVAMYLACLLYTSPSPRDKRQSRMPSSA